MSNKTDVTKLDNVLRQIEANMIRLYGSTYTRVLQIQQVRTAIAAGKTFKWMEEPGALKQFEDMLATLNRNVTLLTSNGINTSAKQGTAAAMKTTDPEATPEEVEEAATQATNEHRDKTTGGFKSFTLDDSSDRLSDRVWKLNEGAKKEMEIILQNGIKQGLTAQQIAQSIQGYLQNPTSLYRRVRDKETGLLELSEAAKQYHPGPGVYRSAYQNALRLARTEINAAYQRAEQERYAQDPNILGIKIRKSNNHTTMRKGKEVELNDMCDQLQGEYPKDFIFSGWHPNCRCVMVPIIGKPKDVREGRAKAIQNLPPSFISWIQTNQQRILTARQTPYFVRNNKEKIAEEVDELSSAFNTLLDVQPGEQKGAPFRQQEPQPDTNLAVEQKIDPIIEKAKAILQTATGENTERLRAAIENGNKAEIEKATAVLDAAIKRHAERTPERAEELRQYQQEKREVIETAIRFREITKNNVILKYCGFWTNGALYDHKPIADIKKAMEDDIKSILQDYVSKEADIEKRLNKAQTTEDVDKFIAYLSKIRKKINGATKEEYDINRYQIIENIIVKFEAQAAAKKSAIQATQPAAQSTGYPQLPMQKKEITSADVNRADRTKYIQKTLGVDMPKAKSFIKGVSDYSGDYYDEMRLISRGEKYKKGKFIYSEQELKDNVNAVEEFIARAPKWGGGTTYRGLAVPDNVLSEFNSKMKTKTEIDMLGMASWTTARHVAEEYAIKNEDDTNNKKIIIICKEPQQGTSIAYLSQYEREHEVLCSVKCRYIITDINKVADFSEVYVTPVLTP